MNRQKQPQTKMKPVTWIAKVLHTPFSELDRMSVAELHSFADVLEQHAESKAAKAKLDLIRSMIQYKQHSEE